MPDHDPSQNEQHSLTLLHEAIEKTKTLGEYIDKGEQKLFEVAIALSVVTVDAALINSKNPDKFVRIFTNAISKRGGRHGPYIAELFKIKLAEYRQANDKK